MAEGEPVLGSIYVYAPNQIAPIFFAIAFACSAAGHIWQCYRYKAFLLVGLHPGCAIILTAGYALREYGSFNYLYSHQNLVAFICSQIFIYICPPALELANYHVLSRVFHYVPHLPPLRPNHVMRTFGGLMAIVETLNSVGVSLFANPTAPQSQLSLGKNLVLAAIIIQLAIIIIFFVMTGIFHFRCAKAGFTRNKTLTTPLFTLYASMVLIFVRCIYRLVEKTAVKSVWIQDLEELKRLSPLLRYEVFFYIFEASLMLVNSVMWNIWHPGRFLPRSHRVHLGEDGSVVITEPKDGKLGKRPLLLTVGNILTFGLLDFFVPGEKEKGRE
ncbi:putative RTA1 domain protein [Lasiosphaeria miniovina]|uniref:RTA1 domain protein n=1 Tax=Lasiosphaeria miniovina TaxID=1954250 RepID=A0AA40ATL6_9PEZI|nr:putative RTA1 domain protein [Lasiosphaeria miniovina]KAK0721779.1 putative RTA1 domain protein [Lasiosphaeria miniovina]